MPTIKVFGEGFTIKLTDELGQDAGVLTIGENNISYGTYEAEIILDEGYIFKRGIMIDSVGQETEIDSINFTFDVYSYQAIEEIHITTEYQPPSVDVSGFNHLYLVDKEILKSLASERFLTGGESTIDLGTYIINVLELPFKLDDSVKGVENNIVLGYVSATTKAIELILDEIIVDFGNIHVPAKYNNSYDYMNTEVRLHLPYANTVELNVNYVIGHDINVKYIIDLYTGDMTINVISSKINNIIHSETSKIGRDIPFIRRYSNEAINSITSKNGLNNGLLKPFIEVIRNIPYEKDNLFKNEVITYGKIENFDGFIKVNNIILNSSATQQEKTSIINLLQGGVYINDL